ncbi:FxLD family lanthipeptide [Actinomadura sp. 3N508]|uniref:FxLD family lanthipeptide n=1 Tax=Actinomadura sp. 3N508 TaxID=3375153 RepID=UPI0037BB0868
MTAVHSEQPVTPTQPTNVADSDDPFHLDITFIENTPATEAVLMCSTGDNCGSSCPSACTTS